MEHRVTGDEYEILVGARLDRSWATWFDDFALTAEDGSTRLRGRVRDQAALHGALARFRDLGIPILDIHQLPAVEEERRDQ